MCKLFYAQKVLHISNFTQKNDLTLINDILDENLNGRAKKNKTKAKAFCKHLTLVCFAVATAFVSVLYC